MVWEDSSPKYWSSLQWAIENHDFYLFLRTVSKNNDKANPRHPIHGRLRRGSYAKKTLEILN